MAQLKQLARKIFHETLAAIDIPATMQRKLLRKGAVLVCGETKIDLGDFEKLRVVAIGKAAHAMVDGLELVLSPFLRIEGVVSAPTPARRPVPGMKYFIGGHPVPNAESWKAAEAILALLKRCDEKTLVFFLLSGGGSALVELPLDSRQTLEDVQKLHRTLVSCGAPIDAINTVRKHLSAVKGGRLAAAAQNATKITLAVSDVPVGKESALASGPTLPDPTTVADVKRIVAEYSLQEKFPTALQAWLDKTTMPETPKANDAVFRNSHFLLLLGMDDLFHPAHHAAEANGFIACCDNATDDWPVEKATENLLEQLEALWKTHAGHRVALIADGEVSSPVTRKWNWREEFGIRAGVCGKDRREENCGAQRWYGWRRWKQSGCRSGGGRRDAGSGTCDGARSRGCVPAKRCVHFFFEARGRDCYRADGEQSP